MCGACVSARKQADRPSASASKPCAPSDPPRSAPRVTAVRSGQLSGNLVTAAAGQPFLLLLTLGKPSWPSPLQTPRASRVYAKRARSPTLNLRVWFCSYGPLRSICENSPHGKFTELELSQIEKDGLGPVPPKTGPHLTENFEIQRIGE